MPPPYEYSLFLTRCKILYISKPSKVCAALQISLLYLMTIRKASRRAFFIGSSMDEVVDTIEKLGHVRQDMIVKSVTVHHMVSEMMYQSG